MELRQRDESDRQVSVLSRRLHQGGGLPGHRRGVLRRLRRERPRLRAAV